MVVINNTDRARQIISFKGLKYGKMSPTDLDCLIEYKNRAYIFIEVKCGSKELPLGQRLALERLVKDTSKGKRSIAMVCEHKVFNTEYEVLLKDTIVRKIYLDKECYWREPKRRVNAKQAIEVFINQFRRT